MVGYVKVLLSLSNCWGYPCFFVYFPKIPIFFGLLATLCTGWPFAAALFVPLGLRAIYLASTASHNATTNGAVIANICLLLIRTLFHASLIQAIVTAIDYYYYQNKCMLYFEFRLHFQVLEPYQFQK